MNDTHLPAEKQPSNGFGRVPDSLLPTIAELPNQAAKLFLVLCVLARRSPKDDRCGQVCQSVSEIARVMGIPRKSVYRGMETLVSSGLIVSPRHRGGCVTVTHYLCHEDTKTGHGDTGGVSSGHTTSPQPTEPVEVVSPLYEVNTVNEVNTEEEPAESVASGHKEAAKRKLFWDEELRALDTEDFEWWDEFTARWGDELGNETFKIEMRKAQQWLSARPKRRTKKANFTLFLENWMKRCIGQGEKSGSLF